MPCSSTPQTASGREDAAFQAAAGSVDVRLQQAVAAAAAGADPIAPSDPRLVPTPGMDWLERMCATDEAMKAAIDKRDASLRPSG